MHLSFTSSILSSGRLYSICGRQGAAIEMREPPGTSSRLGMSAIGSGMKQELKTEGGGLVGTQFPESVGVSPSSLMCQVG